MVPALAEVERLALRPGDALAISWGSTLCEVAQAQRFPALRGVRLIPAVGGMDEVDVRFQPNEIARRMADGSGAECSLVT